MTAPRYTARGHDIPTADQIERVKQAAGRFPGITIKQIADELGMNSHTVRSAVDRLGIKIYPATVVFEPTAEQRVWLRREADRIGVSPALIIGACIDDAMADES